MAYGVFARPAGCTRSHWQAAIAARCRPSWRRLTAGRARLACPERDDWRATAQAAGFDFHTIDGERYWDERAYYAFTLDEIERQIEAPTGEIDAMCLELVGRAIDDERNLRRLKIPEAFWPLIRDSWHRDEASLYGRLDLSFDGRGPAKLLEYNADTPTSIFEAAVFQWTWLEQAIERHILPARADQFNSIHERLIEAWKKVGTGRHLHLTGVTENTEDAGTLAYLEDTARQAGVETTLLDIEAIGWRDDGGFVDLDNREIELAFKLYPWEWMFHEAFGARLAKAADALDRAAVEGHPFQQGHASVAVGDVSGPPQFAAGLFRGRSERSEARHLLRAQAALFPRRSQCRADHAKALRSWSNKDRMAPKGFIRQALAPLPNFSGQYPVLGSWLIDHTPCGLSIREDENPITGNTSRFVPHAIL